MRANWTILAAAIGSACGSDSPATGGVSALWAHDTPAAAAPPGVGAEARALVVLREAGPLGGRLITLDQRNGTTVEGPFDGILLSEHAPVMADNRVFMLTKVGALVGLSLAGETLFTVPPTTPSATSPLALGSDQILRWGTASGDVVGVRLDGTPAFRATVGDPVVNALGLGDDGRAYATTDTGRVVGVDATGAIVFDVRVDGPASGASVSASGEVAVGEVAGVRAFTAGGAEKWSRGRAARVVGTAWAGERVVAWGEDGRVERLDAAGGVDLEFATAPSNPPPVYAPAVLLATGAIGVVDASGQAHLIGPDGAAIASISVGGEPLREATVGESDRLLIAVGAQVKSIAFVYTAGE